MATWLSNQTYKSTSPAVEGSVGYSSISRNGNTVSYTIGFRAHTTSSGGWRNNRWACSLSLGNGSWTNATVKNKTSGTIGTTYYYANSGSKSETCPFSSTVSVGTDASSISVSVTMYDTGNATTLSPISGGTWGPCTFTIPIPTLPTANMTLGTPTETTQPVSWSSNSSCIARLYYRKSTDSSYSYVQMNSSAASSGSYTLTGLSANTTYYYYVYLWKSGDTGLYRQTDTQSKTTLALPSFSSISTSYSGYLPLSTNTSENVVFTLTNPNSVSITCYVKNANDSGTLFGSASTTGTSCTVAANVSTMRNAIGTSTTGTYYCYCIATLKSGATYTIPISKTGTYWGCTQTTVANNDCTITVGWTSPLTPSSIIYSLDNFGSSSTTVTTTSTTGTAKTSTLSEATIYNVRIKVATSSYGTVISNAVIAVETSAWPYLTSISTSNLAIGSAQTFTMLNPLQYTVTVYAKLEGSTVLTLGTSNAATGTSFNFTPAASSLYAAIPSKTKGSIEYYCTYTESSGTAHTGASISGTFYLDETANKPAAATVTYIDTNSTTKTLMNDSGLTLIQGKSNLQITATGYSAKNSASIASCITTVGSVSKDHGTSGGSLDFGTLSYGSNVTATTIVKDTRGLTNTTTKTIIYKPWSVPTATYTVARNGGYDASGTLKATGSYSSLKNTSNTECNAISSFYYFYWNKTTHSTISIVSSTSSVTATDRYYFIPSGTSGSVYKYNGSSAVVVGTTEGGAGAITSGSTISFSNVFNTESEYGFKIYITDKVGGTSNYEFSLGKGQPIQFLDSNNLGVGINRFPAGDGLYVQKIHLGDNAYLYYNSTDNTIEVHFN